MREQSSDVVLRQVGQVGVAALLEHQRVAVLPQGLVDMHAGAVLLEDRLGHEGRGLAGAPGLVLDHVLVDHHLVRHPQERLEAHVDLALAA